MTRVLHVLPHRGGGAETYLDLVERLDGFTHRRVALAPSADPLRAVPAILARWPGIARAPADVVHVHGDVAATLMVPVLRSRPSVWTTHGLHALRRGVPGVRRGTRAALAAAETLCCSQAEREELGGGEVVPNGVDPVPPVTAGQRAQARRALGVEGRVALFLGELDERKDPLTAARAARAAGVTLLVAGDGPLRGALEGIDGVRVLGHRSDVETLLRAADTFVLPSLREGIAFAVLEAMAHGLAMVVSDGPGNPEAVGDAGVVVPVGDVDGFAAALRRDPAPLGAAARERVRREFPVQRLLDGVRAAYLRALGQAPGAARA